MSGELYKNNKYPTSTAERNTEILKRVEQDIAVLREEVSQIKNILSFIQEYIKLKKEREDAKWFY